MLKNVLFLFFLTSAWMVQAQDFPTTQWNDLANTDWYDASQTSFDIANAEDLAGLSVLVANGNDFEGKTINITADIDLDGNLWQPIGTDVDLSFAGDVHGNGHTVSNLWINRPTEDMIGLFGSVLSSEIKDLNVDNATVYGQFTTGVLVANLAVNSLMENCHVSNGYVHGEGGAYGDVAGGLVGGLLTGSQIKKCSFSGEVHGGNQIGGLVGTAWDTTLIEESFSEGIVDGDNIVGGLVGFCTMNFPPEPNTTNIVRNSYSRADVSGTGERVGGLYGSPEVNGMVENCYSTGTVQGTASIGGSIGSIQYNTTVANTYFDTETSGTDVGIGDYTPGDAITVTGKTTSEMKSQAMVDLLNADQTAIWSIDPAVNDGYPYLTGNTLSIEDVVYKADKIAVYPTISTNLVNFRAEGAHFSVYDMTGRLLDRGAIAETPYGYDVSSLESGVYLVVFEGNGKKSVKRFIKK